SGRERIDHRGTYAVQPTRCLVIGILELSARVQRGEDDLDSGLLQLRVFIDRDTSPVVTNRDARSVFVQSHRDFRSVAVHGFVDGVVEHFPHQVVKPRRTHSADVHPRTLSHRVQTLENSDVACSILGHSQLSGSSAKGGRAMSGERTTSTNEPRFITSLPLPPRAVSSYLPNPTRWVPPKLVFTSRAASFAGDANIPIRASSGASFIRRTPRPGLDK